MTICYIFYELVKYAQNSEIIVAYTHHQCQSTFCWRDFTSGNRQKIGA